ncbi:MAG: BatA domain-containing protein [Anaerolineae bacterium]|nr:BatA domain-containing protein [Gemmatimonadaceae bacterium]
MIGFLTPLWLIAGIAAAIPLLIHLLRRRIGTRVEFPAVRYLARAEREHSRKLKLRNLLLMLLRVFTVLVIVLAAARPVLRAAGTGHAPTALALVIDNGLSSSLVSNGQPVLGALKDRAREVVRRATAEDKVWLFTADGAIAGGSRGTILDAIDRLEPLAGAGAPARAVAAAAALVRQDARQEHEVALFTDAQATTWRSPVILGDVRLRVFVPSSPLSRNRGVTSADAVPVRWTPRGAVRARILTPDSATYRITLDGRTLARGTAGRDEEVAVRAAPAERGWTAGGVEIEPDELRGDDVRHFAVWIGAPPGIAVHAAVGEFAKSAIDALIQADRVTSGNDIAFVPVDEAVRLPALLVVPSDPVRIGAANRALERLGVPWRLGPLKRGESAVRGPGARDAQAAQRLANVSATLRYTLIRRPGESGEVLATAGGEPWIVRGAGYVLIASPLLPAATTFPIRASFVPWLGDALSHGLTGTTGSVVMATPASAVPRPAIARELEVAGGARLPLTADTLQAPDRAGAYFFYRGGTRVGALVVNAEPEESVLARLGDDALKATLGTRQVGVAHDAPSLAAMVLSSAPRRSLLIPLVVAALVLVLAESVIAGTGVRRAA